MATLIRALQGTSTLTPISAATGWAQLSRRKPVITGPT
jgi:hypothetical protein